MARPTPVRDYVDAVALGGGLDVVSAPFAARPGTCRYASNYEAVIGGGGYERVRGYERFDGHTRPSDGVYATSVPATTFTGLVVGATVTGVTSGTTGKLIYIDPTGWIALTRMTGAFTVGENLQTGGITRGVHSATEPTISGTLDNALNKLVATEYRASILQPTGSGPIRGIAVLGSDVFAWRNNAGNTAMVIHKATASGWTPVTMLYQTSFTTGTAEWAEGSSITQAGNSATVKRVVLESGTWAGGTAAGRIIHTAPTPGAFTGGAAAGGGAASLVGSSAQITLAPNGRVETDVGNFTASLDTKRLYGCDGVNQEFEFDGTVYVPINTGMGSVRASFVKVHKNSLWFAYKGSLQTSALGLPYQWSAVLGAAELGIGDTITGLVSVGGSEAAAAMIVFGLNSAHVLYGTSSADYALSPLSFEAGVAAYSAQDMGRPMTFDVSGFRVWSPTQSFGNFVWESASAPIDPIVRQQTVACSVFNKALGRYRCFFTDGSCMSGTPSGKGFAWMPLNLPHTVVVAHSAEVAGITRTFYGTADGYVMEADVGRSFDGAVIDHSIKLSALHQKSPAVVKTYRRMEIEAVGRSAYTLSVGVELTGEEQDGPNTTAVDLTALVNFGNALVWGGSAWGSAQWGSGESSRLRSHLEGLGVSIAPLMGGSADDALSHELKTVLIHYASRRLARAV